MSYTISEEQYAQQPIELGPMKDRKDGPSEQEIASEEPPAHAVDAYKWNYPRSNLVKTASTFFAFIVMGANDAVYGAIIPSLETYYNISYTIVSLVFLSPFLGYILAALLNNTIHVRFGQRGVAFLGPGVHLAAYGIIVAHPPYPALVAAFVLAGFGNGVLDGAWNAWIGGMANANEVLGFLHGFYGIGAVLSPAIATSMITKANLEWYHFYYIMIGGAGLELVSAVISFWPEDGASFVAKNPNITDDNKGGLRKALKQRVTWVTACFLLIYVGIEVALGGWIVKFMIRVRDAGRFQSGMTATGFWLGLTIGRFALGFLTPRLGEKLSITLYLILAIVMQLIFWLVPSFLLSAVMVAVVGFLIGPMFPTAIVATTKLLPSDLHVAAIGFGAAFGGGGACILPFATGAIAQHAGIQALQPVILALLAIELVLWAFAMPKMPKDENSINDKVTDFARMIARRVTRRGVAA